MRSSWSVGMMECGVQAYKNHQLPHPNQVTEKQPRGSSPDHPDHMFSWAPQKAEQVKLRPSRSQAQSVGVVFEFVSVGVWSSAGRTLGMLRCACCRKAGLHVDFARSLARRRGSGRSPSSISLPPCRSFCLSKGLAG